ncbi:unnamed protein product [Rhizoctonia solani]|uniref:Uncharacterized protein n=1 Tax=Rhizoctonia solani TaxID=456999 RepID=A0A8H3B4U1_9AGAM|nr:unnamed protein product [Rhizoctonia solani]
MALRVVGGYLLTYQEAVDAAHKFGLSWDEDRLQLKCRHEINRWIMENAPQYWSNRLQPILVEESGQSTSKLIFPIVGNSNSVPPNFQYSETEGTPAKFRQDARDMGLPDEFFMNFKTIHNPEMHFTTPRGCKDTIVRLRAR